MSFNPFNFSFSKNVFLFFLLTLPVAPVVGQDGNPVDSLYELSLRDLSAFAHQLTSDDEPGLEQAETIVEWFAQHFNWTYTDYQQRTIEEILARKGGNCYELARVSQACLELLEVPIRRIREINLHLPTPRRQVDAEKKVQELGARASVFGHRHNDHVWLEIYDRVSDSWVPADPSLGVVGMRKWLAARYGFGKRYSLDPTSADMIAPFAVFTRDGEEWINLTRKYAIDGFNELYYGQLTDLESWPKWTEGVEALEAKALGAFQNKTNLHQHTAGIKVLSEIYQQLKAEFLQTDLGQIHTGIDNFSAALIAGEYDKVVGAYTEDGKIFPNNAPILEGSELIRNYWTPRPGRTSRTVHHRIIPEEIRILGHEAYDWGYYEGRTRLEDGTEVPWRGKYVIVWKKSEEGDWKIYLDIWNGVAD
ncbi:DUF4440 domain-containing protein [Flavilitoribacter nigricans]|uniref:DUF4440 domain-containing protein n=1 Tax=Flavilitoribacter nigricans (strain ATCC 23147 / DSM 23189 / NBRC 102662 / NCIMB 1420 / SS-2) TaxID=1122177 RepID=A0A2D0NAS2_FLAN2|nr:transglutaminase domain-containing protein [Flavilitoribacter nigricans]PHN05460.1 hypothetical protein CRP01_15810 [Flavilitoribacter nigricans DSM 23189 = NBRC 102662]